MSVQIESDREDSLENHHVGDHEGFPENQPLCSAENQTL